jgi:putative redox protein
VINRCVTTIFSHLTPQCTFLFEISGLGPAPYDTLLAALGECTAITVRWYALRQNWPLEKIEVSLTYHKEGRQDIFEKAITLQGNALTVEQRAKLIDVAAKCPVQRTLEGTPIIHTKDNG